MLRDMAPSATRSRQERSVRNDERILDAALALADDTGWAGLSVARVAERAGLSRPAVLDRFAGRPEIAAAVWRYRLAEPVHAALSAVVDAATPPAGGVDADALGRSLMAFAVPDRPLRAAAELILVGRYERRVAGALGKTITPAIAGWVSPGRGAAARTAAAVRAYAINLALGLLLEGRRHALDDLSFSREFALLADALARPAQPVPLPRRRPPHLAEISHFDTGDDGVDAVLYATLFEVGSRGFEATTIDVIIKASGRTRGFIFSRYPTKQAIFLDATQRHSEVSASLFDVYLQALAGQTSEGIADAVATRELMRPECRLMNTFALELYRLAWHDPVVCAAMDAGFAPVIADRIAKRRDLSKAEARASVVMEIARGHGPLVLAVLDEVAWSLPYDVVTVPLLAPTSSRSQH